MATFYLLAPLSLSAAAAPASFGGHRLQFVAVSAEGRQDKANGEEEMDKLCADSELTIGAAADLSPNIQVAPFTLVGGKLS